MKTTLLLMKNKSKRSSLFFLLTFFMLNVFGQIPNYEDWYIQNDYLTNGNLHITEGETKQIKFNVEVWRFIDSNGDFIPVNFQFQIRRLPGSANDWCNPSETISSTLSITDSDFEDGDNLTEKEFVLEVTQGTGSGELRNNDEIFLFVNDADYGFACSNWFPVEKSYNVVVEDNLTVPSSPTNVSATRTGDGSSVKVEWNNNGDEIDAAQVRYRSVGGSWSSNITTSSLTSHTLSGMGTSAREFQARSHNPAGWSSWSGVASVSALNLSAPNDVVMFKPYYYNLTWSDPNPSILTGKIEVQKSGYYGSPDAYYTVYTINDLHSTDYSISSGMPTDTYRLKLTDSFGRVVYSNIADENQLNAPSQLRIFRPYYYNLEWEDPNSSLITGTVEIQKGGYYGNPDAFYTIATYSNIHLTDYTISSSLPTDKYRIKLTDQLGRVVYSNIADETQLKAVSDLEVINPYYFNLDWSDPNSSLLTGTIEVQRNGYYGSATAFYTIGTISNLHTTTYYLGSSNPGDIVYRLKMIDQVGRVVYSNEASLNSGGRMTTDSQNQLVIDSSFDDTIFQIEAYPIPADDKLSIKRKDNNPFSYQIYDMQGKMVLSGLLLYDEIIDVSGLKEGIYMLSNVEIEPIKIVIE